MPNKKNKMRWVLVLLLGIIAVAIGVFINAYAIVVVQSGPFPAKSGGFQIAGFFVIGVGMGYMALTPLIKIQEEKIKKMEQELP